MERWEYKIIDANNPEFAPDPELIIEEREKLFNNLGQEGWELVLGIKAPEVRPVFYFKRKIEDTYR